MKLPNNIEKSYFVRGEYVAYCKAGVQRIKKGGLGWKTYCSLNGKFLSVTAKTLREIGVLLEKEID